MKFYTDVELADIQEAIGALMERLEYYKANYPYATYEIDRMETALDVMNDLENDVANMD